MNMTSSTGSHKMDRAVDLTCFKELMLSSCGFSLENEREQALSASICRRMASSGIDSLGEYYALLLRDKEELLRLTELLTVNETYFFREPEHLKLMIDKLLPGYIPGYVPGRNIRPIRILSAGCSTGEEPYSIAIMLRERYGSECERLFAITGVDIDSSVIAGAKRGVFGKGSFRGMDQTMLERYFEPAGPGKFQIRDVIRKQVGFEVVNLLGASYPQGMLQPDIILYRNVSIYFPVQIQQEIFGRLAGILNIGGCLLVGATETMHHDTGILSLEMLDSLFYYRKAPPLVIGDRRAESRRFQTPDQPRSRLQLSPAERSTNLKALHMEHQGRPANRDNRQPSSSMTVKDIKERFDTALGLARNRQPDEALGLLDAIIRQDTTFTKAYTLKASLLLSASRFDEAVTVCTVIVERDPLCLEAYLMLGMIARHKGNDDAALKRFREAIYLNASCWLAHFYTAEIMFVQNDAKRARNSYETTLRILEKGTLNEHGQAYFPLAFNADQFIVISRHKLSLLAPKKG
jgi:chemotaxis protein methyltransferase CheR